MLLHGITINELSDGLLESDFLVNENREIRSQNWSTIAVYWSVIAAYWSVIAVYWSVDIKVMRPNHRMSAHAINIKILEINNLQII